MAAVGADRTPEPVRSFGTFTTDLHQLVDWFKECGVEMVVMDALTRRWAPSTGDFRRASAKPSGDRHGAQDRSSVL
jgi:hypothetical protein